MTRKTLLIAAGAIVLVAGLGLTARPAAAQADVTAAIAAGTVGEQVDGYLGVRGSVAAGVRAGVDSINIKRRAAYTDLATKRAVTVREVAASVGCQTLRTRVGQGQAYMLDDGVWRTRGADPIALPAYCG